MIIPEGIANYNECVSREKLTLEFMSKLQKWTIGP